jgi:cytochrome P450
MTNSSVDLSTFNLFDPAVQQCPFPHYAQMRIDSPVFKVPGAPIYVVTTHELCLEVLRDWQRFSSKFGSPAGRTDKELESALVALRTELGGYRSAPTMLTADPPEHSRHRRLVSKAFSPKAVTGLEPMIRQITQRLLHGVLASLTPGSCTEFVAAFAVPLPVETIAAALGVPDDRLDDFKRWSDATIAGFGATLTSDERLRNEREIIAFQLYFAEQLELRRQHPTNDVLSNLVNAENDGSDGDAPLDMPEMLSILMQLLVAGNETTTKLLTETVRLLAEHPQVWRTLKEDPSHAPAIIEEALRLSSPTQGMWRIVVTDTELGGVQLHAGDKLIVMFASANRDEQIFEDPDEFRPGRMHAFEQLAFGKGTHYCLGANLTRLEGIIFLEEFSSAVAAVDLAPNTPLHYNPSFMLRGLTSLDVVLQPEVIHPM